MCTTPPAAALTVRPISPARLRCLQARCRTTWQPGLPCGREEQPRLGHERREPQGLERQRLTPALGPEITTALVDAFTRMLTGTGESPPSPAPAPVPHAPAVCLQALRQVQVVSTGRVPG